MKITDQQVVEAVKTILQAKQERGLSLPVAAVVGEVPDVVTEALASIGLPSDDAKAKGPRSPLTDAEVDSVVHELEAALARDKVTADLAKSALGFLGLG